MRARRYAVKIYDGELDFTHDNAHFIAEFFVPEKNIAFNTAGPLDTSELHVLDVDEPRIDKRKRLEASFIDVEVPDDLVNRLIAFKDLKKKLTVEVENL